jgi:hypothetical protein
VTTSTQLTLIRPESFRPVPSGARHYVAALQSKSGERDALAHVSTDTWAHLTPLVEILGPKTGQSEPYTHSQTKAWVRKVSDVVGVHPCFLDTLRIRPNHRVATSAGEQPVLSVLHSEARKRGMAFVPTLWLGDGDRARSQIRDCAGADGRGVALRYPLLGSVSVDGRSTETLIKEALDAVEVDVGGADLILDLDFLTEDVDIEAGDIAVAIDGLVAIGDWRSVVLIGSSMPRSLGGGIVPEGTFGRLPRREWELWCALARLRPGRMPTFGDYAVQNPKPPLEAEPSGPGQRANIRYTTDDATLVPRAVGAVIQEGAEQYRDLCRQLVAQPEFAGSDFSWGDREIEECADGFGSPGSQHKWRGAGTSHHLRHVVDQLARVS